MSGTDTWAQLTLAQQSEALAFMPMFRANISALAVALRVLNQNVSLWNNGGLSTLFALMTPTDIIPDTTGLAGAQPLTVSDVTQTMSSAISLLGTYYTAGVLTEFVKIAGPPNV
jgi:hypothetical protein